MKKEIVLLVSAIMSLLYGCGKNTPESADEQLPAGTVLSAGSFTRNSHPTSGTAKIVRDAAGKIFLIIENFSSDNGPDLRVWLSPSTTANPYQEIGPLKAVTGNFFYELGSSVNYTTNNRVLIWCEDFSVLFGHAVLQ